jgi:hypothetical protein
MNPVAIGFTDNKRPRLSRVFLFASNGYECMISYHKMITIEFFWKNA